MEHEQAIIREPESAWEHERDTNGHHERNGNQHTNAWKQPIAAYCQHVSALEQQHTAWEQTHRYDAPAPDELTLCRQRIAELEHAIVGYRWREQAFQIRIKRLNNAFQGQADAALQDENRTLHKQIATLEHQLAVSRRTREEERTQRLAAETALHRSEMLFRSLIESNRDPILVIHDDTIRHMNSAAEELLGRPASDLVGEPIGFLIASELTEVDLPGPQGVRIADMQVVDIEWEGQSVSLASLRDITSYKHMAEELRHTNEALEQRVEARTAELLQANEALRESEERFRTIANFTYDWEYWQAPEGHYLYVSPSCERITGYPPDVFYADPHILQRLVHPDDQALLAQHLANKEGDSQSKGIEFRIISRTGDERWIGHVCQPVYGADGRWLGRRGSNRDITEQKHAELSLRKTNELLEKLFSSIHVHIAYLDRHYTFIRVNAAYAAADNQEPAYFVGKNHFDLYPNPENEALFRQVVATGQPYTEYARAFQFPDHPERGISYWDWTLYPVKDVQGEVESLILSMVNVTGQVEAEEAYHMLVDHAIYGLIIMQDEQAVFVNPTAASILGYNADTLRAMSHHELTLIVHPDDRPMLTRRVQDRRQGSPASSTFALRIIRQDGTLRWLEIFVASTTYRGHPALQISYLDVTERKWAQEAYRTLVDHSLQGLAILQADRIAFVNPAMTTILGYTAEELLASTAEDISMRVYPDDRERTQDYLHKRLSGQAAPTRYETRLVRKDGTIRWVEVYAVEALYQGQPASQVAYVDITERKQAEHELEHARTLLQTIFESVAEGIVVFANDQGIMAHNHRFETIWGLPDTWQHLTTWEQQSTLLVEQVADPWGFAQQIEGLATASEYEGRDTIQLADGRLIEYHCRPYRVDGVVVGQVWSMLDVTSRVQAEQALRESEARYRALVQNFPDGVVLLFDQDMRFLVAGGKQLAAIGLAPDMLEGKTLQEAVPPDVAEIGLPLYRATLDGTAPGSVEQHYGEYIYRTQPVPLRNEQGQIVAGMIISQDITERKQMQIVLEQRVQERTAQLFSVVEQLHSEIGERERSNQELEQSRNLLRVIFDSIGDSLILLTRSGQVLSANQPAATLLGWPTPTDLIQQGWADLCHRPGCNGDRPASVFPGQWVLKALSRNQPQQRRETVVMPDGTSVTLDMQLLPLVPLVDEGNKVPDQPSLEQMVLHIANVTERLQLEKLQFENERLATIRKLTQIVAHEVNTPLQTILNALEGLQLADERYRTHFLSLAQAEIERVGAILHRLKDPLQSPTEALQPVHIPDLLQRVLTIADSMLRKRHIDVEHETAPEPPVLPARPDQLTQVFLNLILNAMEAMPEGGTLRVRTSTLAAQPDNGAGGVQVEIHDTGIGIAPDIQERIFEAFFTTRAMGTGLGLSVSQKIVTDHGGTISVRSTPGVGSVFTVFLPNCFIPMAR